MSSATSSDVPELPGITYRIEADEPSAWPVGYGRFDLGSISDRYTLLAPFANRRPIRQNPKNERIRAIRAATMTNAPA